LQDFDINAIVTNILGYDLSYLELIGTISGLICVWLAAKQYILTWPIGIINIFCLFIIFYDNNLYADMFLQVYFFIVAIYGWYTWTFHKSIEKDVVLLSSKSRLTLSFFVVIISIATGFGMSKIHTFLPDYFKEPAAFPFLDSFIAIGSVFANIMMAKRIVENWILWIIIDIVAVYVYFQKGIVFIAILYGVYCLIAWNGYSSWRSNKIIR
jgi:nicotinamide mononucleotide transporter